MSAAAFACPGCGHPLRHTTPPKSRIVFMLLGLFLGGIGVHNFYAGHIAKGVFQLLFALLGVSWLGPMSCGAVYVLWGIYILIDSVVTSHDGDGRRMI